MKIYKDCSYYFSSYCIITNITIIYHLLHYTTLQIYYCHCLCPLISLHPLSYNIARCGLGVTVWCLSDDPSSLIGSKWLLICYSAYLCKVLHCYFYPL